MSQPDPNAPRAKPRWTGGAVALVVIGLLILIPSGLCASVWLVSMLYVVFQLGGGGGLSPLLTANALFASLTIILFPVALGVALVYLGLNSRRRD